VSALAFRSAPSRCPKPSLTLTPAAGAHNTLRVSILRLEHLTLSGRGCLGFVYTDSEPIVQSISTTLLVIRKCTDSVPICPCVVER
jgi:hypothetical protein